MGIYTYEDLKVALDNHLHWLRQDIEGWERMRLVTKVVDLTNMDLRYSILINADLSYADLSGSNLTGANLEGAFMYGTIFDGAILARANLSNAILDHASFHKARLEYANLSRSDLTQASLEGSQLIKANLFNAVIDSTYFRNNDLTDAIGIPMVCPSEGSFIGWKKALNMDDECKGPVLIKLLIPEDAKRSSATGRKCRCDKAIVLNIYDKDGNEVKSARSIYDIGFYYIVGETILPDSFNENRWDECSGGIHFFITKEEAKNYTV